MSSRKISVLGSTGSIGQSTLDLIKFHKDKFTIVALTAHKNVELLVEQAKYFRPEVVAIGDESLLPQLRSGLSGEKIEIMAGQGGITQAASYKADLTIAAISGMIGLKPLMAAMGQSKAIAIANKEPLVATGDLVLDEAKKTNTKILPLDSEHNAIFQVFENANRDAIDKLILTASGGPFRTWTSEQMKLATLEQALKHPNWSMGSKITIDSATMMNKGLEIIEATYLFDMPADKIDVLIHPQSTVHSMVVYKDGSTLAQLGAPDMRTPIAYALAYPGRIETSGQKLDWSRSQNMEFYPPDFGQFPSLALAYAALKQGGSAPAILNAANEVAVAAFLEKKIGFGDIIALVDKTLESHAVTELKSLDDVINLDKSVRELTKSYII